MKVEECLACRHTIRVLRGTGIETMEALAALTRGDLMKLRGIGPVIADGLEKAIEEWKKDHAEQALSGNDRI